MQTNPFDPATDPDRHEIWHKLIIADTDAFIAGDFSLIEPDFAPDHFEGIRCANSTNPDNWKIAFATLAEYRQEWLASSRQFLQKKFVGITHRDAILCRCRIDQIDIKGDRALAHKKFSGTLDLADGTQLTGTRQTIYRLHKQNNAWKIVGFLGQLPLDQNPT